MDTVMIVLKMFIAAFLIAIAVYSMVYFGQISKVENQFGLKLPHFIKKILGVLTMVPMAVSLAVLLIVLFEVVMT